MLKQYEELSVLEQGDDGAVVSVSGQKGPAVLLGPDYLEHLAVVAERAAGQIAAVPDHFRTEALRLLCAEVKTLVATFQETRNKFYGGPPMQLSLKTALAEIEELRRYLEVALGAPGITSEPTPSGGHGAPSDA